MQQNRENDQRMRHGNSRPAVSGIISWIVETDRRFRVTQDRIDSLADWF